MALETKKPLAVGGLDLGADQTIAPDMVLADGARFEIVGAVTSRLGRVHLSLDYPDEGVGVASDYVQTIDPFTAPSRTRGYGQFYDQRIVVVPPEVLAEPDFTATTPTKWAAVGGFSFPANGTVRYDHNAGANTLTQTMADLNSPADASAEYAFEYEVTNSQVVSLVLTITTGFAAQTVTLTDVSIGRHRVQFTSTAAPGDFVLNATSAASPGPFILENVSLKRVTTRVPVPRRLSIVHKTAGQLWLNDTVAGATDGIISGDGTFTDSATRAKFVSHGRSLFVVDGSDRPKIMRPLPQKEQRLYRRVKYDVRTCGIRWPTASDQIAVLTNLVSADSLPAGIYRVRVQLENKMGDTSNPSLVTAFFNPPGTPGAFTIKFPQVPDELKTGSEAVLNWRVYVSAQYVDSSGFLPSTEPSAFKLWRVFPIATVSIPFVHTDLRKLTDSALLQFQRGSPPRYRDFIVVNGTGYGLPDTDTVFREVTIQEGDFRYAATFEHYWAAQNESLRAILTDTSTIAEIDVTPDMLFVSPPGEPQYSGGWIRMAMNPGERGVGLSVIGNSPVIFTNEDILVLEQGAVKRVHSAVGALSRDSIQKTEDGIRFMGSDGVPRRFNGATIDEVANELLPIFSKPDYSGPYLVFDEQYAGEVSTASGNRRFYMNYPVAAASGFVPAKPTIDSSPVRNLAIGDSRHVHRIGRVLWSCDRSGYDQIQWLGDVSRLLAVDFGGKFYFIEEGFVDEGLSAAPAFDWAWRWFGRGGVRRFHKIKIELDTKGKSVTLLCQVDRQPDLQFSYTISTAGRQEIAKPLPPTFKGLYLEARLFGSTDAVAGRPEVFGVRLERQDQEVF